MLHSMTGYGEAQQELDSFRIGVEILSLNSRFLDIFVTLPEPVESQELEIRRRISKEIPRGRLTVKVRLEPSGIQKTQLSINRRAFLEIARKVKSLVKEAGLKEDFEPVSILRIPGVLCIEEKKETPSNLLPTLWRLVDKALAQLQRSLREEGKKLEQEIRNRLSFIKKSLKEIETFKKREIAQEKKKFEEMATTQAENMHPDERLLQVLGRYDVSEEVTRIRSHLKAINGVLSSRAQVKGRKLEFFCQELHREVTTISQKSLLPEIVTLTVEMREEIERIREQVRNIR